MRLTCPNCGAQYEVPDDVIPKEGRDVQCSNCGDTWYQPANDAQAAPSSFEDVPEPRRSGTAVPDRGMAEEEDRADIPEPEQTAEPEPEEDPTPEPEFETDDSPRDAEESPPTEDQPPAAEPKAAPERRRQRLDPALADILREEAAREAELRGTGPNDPDSQSDIGQEPAEPDEADRRARQSRDRMARMRGENPAEIEAEETGSRSGLLPDIEEINSTLRASEAGPTALSGNPENPPRRRGGFTTGMLLMIFTASLLALVYVNAPQIAKTMPQADPAVSSFVALVDQGRIWLDAQVKSVMPQ